ncbi:MAG: (d)CMP kinase [Chloroflexi bacterium]|nr:(d)CMP kinase [Chloroflexota bacterium]MBU1746418.1 (d)CMP kinase [Chloroflexota bacterium]MBU1877632.1 (d)CMP kinase [Chloroflexota bacterium]
MPQPSTIAIDGTAASGKSTISQLLAQRLGYLYFDTGVTYRAVTWAALDRGIPIADEAAVTHLAETLRIQVLPSTCGDGRQYTVLADGQDVTWAIRRPQVDHGVSPVSAYPGVRQALKQQQRSVGEAGRVVMAGRDIGTVIMPDADLKIFLDAQPEVRAQRRYEELRDRGQPAEYDVIRQDMLRRDRIDSSRAAAPLQAAPDAVIVDTSDLDIEGVLGRLLALVQDHDP